MIIKSALKDYSVEFAPMQNLGGIIISGQNVKRLYLKDIDSLTIDAIEANKNYDYAGDIIKRLLSRGIHRSDRLTVIGGGVTQDICGFIASMLFRGIDWVYYPTTLLAMLDSCIGSKTSINVGRFKNQVGNYYPPNKIIIDTTFLKTLPEDDIKSGMGEAVKFHFVDGCLIDPSEPLETIIRDTLVIKKKYIEKDEFDRGPRLLLGFGHTFGHALESISDYTVKHGQAVAWGCLIANYISLKMAMLPPRDYDLMERLFCLYCPDFRFEIKHIAPFMVALGRDKKTEKNLNCILSDGIGKMRQVEVSFKQIEESLSEYCSHDSRTPG